LVHVAQSTHWDRPPLAHGDGPDYESLAYSLSIGKGFQFAWESEGWRAPYQQDGDQAEYTQLQRVDWPGPTASRPPLYPALIACIYRLVPRGPVAFAIVRSFSALCTACAGALAVGLAFQIATPILRHAWLGNIASIITLLLALFDRTIRTYSVDFLTEPLALLLTTGLVGAALHCNRTQNRRPWDWIGLGILAGMLVLTRSLAVFWLPGIAILIAASSDRVRLRSAAVFLACAFSILAPWWVRNCVVLQEFMPMGGQGAASLRGGYSDEALADQGNWHGEAETRLQQALDRTPGSLDWTQAQREVALARMAHEETRTWIWEHRQELPRLAWMRVRTHWGPYFGPSLLWRIAMVLGWIGLLVERRREALWLLGLPLLSTLTVAMLYETGGRFLVPLYGLLYLVAGFGIVWACDRVWDAWVRWQRW